MLAAVDRATFRGTEGHLGRLAAGGARRVVHWPIATLSTPSRPATLAADLPETVAAVDRTFTRRLERHLGGLVAIRTRGVKHLTLTRILVHKEVVTAFREETEVGFRSR
ncbi:MAG: hypothetical protein G01um101438_183 [Parcubacteria group bacterium Gr01-1014_38]|nr:MAG: hypothetical protein G01um101438_183 [Parcubacteria group bacterium Gr01-1014_38]